MLGINTRSLATWSYWVNKEVSSICQALVLTSCLQFYSLQGPPPLDLALHMNLPWKTLKLPYPLCCLGSIGRTFKMTQFRQSLHKTGQFLKVATPPPQLWWGTPVSLGALITDLDPLRVLVGGWFATAPLYYLGSLVRLSRRHCGRKNWGHDAPASKTSIDSTSANAASNEINIPWLPGKGTGDSRIRRIPTPPPSPFP